MKVKVAKDTAGHTSIGAVLAWSKYLDLEIEFYIPSVHFAFGKNDMTFWLAREMIE